MCLCVVSEKCGFNLTQKMTAIAARANRFDSKLTGQLTLLVIVVVFAS